MFSSSLLGHPGEFGEEEEGEEEFEEEFEEEEFTPGSSPQ